MHTKKYTRDEISPADFIDGDDMPGLDCDCAVCSPESQDCDLASLEELNAFYTGHCNEVFFPARRCYRAGEVRRRYRERSSPAMMSPASPLCRWTRG